MATLDLKYYKGQDDYSDGEAIEDRLLDMAKNQIELENIAQEQIDFPTFYHFSPIREGICCWYPFPKNASILEIGSGCGAITGALCRNGNPVTSVELSQKRARVNYYRHQELDNLTIRVGNLHDMPDLVGKFDFVVVIGVMEYAGKFSGGEEPYLHFLRDIQRYLKPDGKLLLAIENRFGMKYFSGANEDHLNAPFLGLQNYPGHDEVQTFSKGELTELLVSAGFSHTHFYYPYPDYKFPSEIFTDATLKTMGYGKPFRTYDKDRIALFPEDRVAAQLAREGVGGFIANSFLVEASVCAEESLDEIIYVKLNQDRPEQYRISTEIWQTEGKEKHIKKRAQSQKALAHISQISKNEKRMAQIVGVLQGEEEMGVLSYPFLDTCNLGDRIEELARKKETEQIYQLISTTWEQIFRNSQRVHFSGEGFESWFGTVDGDREDLCVNPANVDAIFQNAFVIDDRLLLVDCEWVTDFPVPVSFIQWRMLHLLYATCPSVEKVIPWGTWMQKCGISGEQAEQYLRWEKYFEREFGGERAVAPILKKIYPISAENWGRIIDDFRSSNDIPGSTISPKDIESDLIAYIREVLSHDEVRGLQLADLKNEIHIVQQQGNKQEIANNDLMGHIQEIRSCGEIRGLQLAELKNDLQEIRQHGVGRGVAVGNLLEQFAESKNDLQEIRQQGDGQGAAIGNLVGQFAELENDLQEIRQQGDGQGAAIGKLAEQIAALEKEISTMIMRLEEKENRNLLSKIRRLCGRLKALVRK